MGARALWPRSDPGRRGFCRYSRVSWGHAASRAWTPGSAGVGVGGRHWIPSGACELRLSPQVRRPALSLPGPPRVGFGPRGALEVARPEEFLPFPAGCRARVPGARLPGCRREGPGLPHAASSWNRWRNRGRSGPGGVRSGPGSGNAPVVAFTVKYSLGFGAGIRGMLGKRRLGRDRGVHSISAQRVLMDYTGLTTARTGTLVVAQGLALP